MSFYKHNQDFRYSFYNRLTEEQKKKYMGSTINKKTIIEIYAYALMPNHFHLLVKEVEGRGVFRFLSKIQNSFAKYYNVRNKRFGSVFQNPFKAKHLESDECCYTCQDIFT